MNSNFQPERHCWPKNNKKVKGKGIAYSSAFWAEKAAKINSIYVREKAGKI
jgi:hypothetical protein